MRQNEKRISLYNFGKPPFHTCTFCQPLRLRALRSAAVTSSLQISPQWVATETTGSPRKDSIFRLSSTDYRSSLRVCMSHKPQCPLETIREYCSRSRYIAPASPTATDRRPLASETSASYAVPLGAFTCSRFCASHSFAFLNIVLVSELMMILSAACTPTLTYVACQLLQIVKLRIAGLTALHSFHAFSRSPLMSRA